MIKFFQIFIRKLINEIKVEISKDAKEDLIEIYTYIATKLLAPEAAMEQLNRLEKATKSLNHMPERHRVYDSKAWQDLRIMPIDNYNVFYIANKDTQTVSIARILYCKRNTKDELE